MIVYVARHAWAGEMGDPRWPDDSLRELTDEGAERYRGVIAALAGRDFAPARVATSPYTRCVQTAEILAEAVSPPPKVEKLVSLEPGGDHGAALLWAKSAGADGDVCLVGHAPDVERLTAALVGAPSARLRFAKGAIAAIDFGDSRFDGRRPGVLRWLVTAKALGL